MKRFKYFIVLFIFVLAVSMVMKYLIKSNTPTFILEKLQELKQDEMLMDSIGGYNKFEYSFNKNEVENEDTMKYSIMIKGYKKTLIFKGIQSRDQTKVGSR